MHNTTTWKIMPVDFSTNWWYLLGIFCSPTTFPSMPNTMYSFLISISWKVWRYLNFSIDWNKFFICWEWHSLKSGPRICSPDLGTRDPWSARSQGTRSLGLRSWYYAMPLRMSSFMLLPYGTYWFLRFSVVCFSSLWDNFLSLKQKKPSYSLYTNFLIIKGTIGINYLNIMPSFFIQYFLTIKDTIGINYLDIMPTFLCNTF